MVLDLASAPYESIQCFYLLPERVREVACDHASATCESTHCFSCCWSDSGRLVAMVCAPRGPSKMMRAVGVGLGSGTLLFKFGGRDCNLSRLIRPLVSEKSTDKRSAIFFALILFDPWALARKKMF